MKLDANLNADMVRALSCTDFPYATVHKMLPDKPACGNRGKVVRELLKRGLLQKSHIPGKYNLTDKAYHLRHAHNLVPLPSLIPLPKATGKV